MIWQSLLKSRLLGITQINGAVMQLKSIVQDNTAIANNTYAITQDLSGVAQEIFDDVRKKKF